MHLVVLILTLSFPALIPTLSLPPASRGQNPSGMLNDKDRLMIVETVLRIHAPKAKAGQAEFALTLLANENIKSKSLPSLTGVNIALLDGSRIKEKIAAGEEISYWAFDDLQVQGKTVKVRFSINRHTKPPKCDSFDVYRYEFRKVSSRWRGKLIERSMGAGAK